MNHQQKLEAVRKACIKANPEIVELKFGCEFYQKHRKTGEVLSDAVYVFVGRGIDVRETSFCLTNRYAGDAIGCYDGYASYEVQSEKNMAGYIEIIGRPIRLADVLLALNRKSNTSGYWAVDTTGAWLDMRKSVRHIMSEWNLRKDSLDEQSEETISFLYELLK